MTPVHVCIDLETLALTPDAHILTIGAVAWEEGCHIGDYLDVFKVVLDEKGRTAALLSTVKWWMTQSTDAKKEAFAIGDTSSIRDALLDLRWWLRDFGDRLAGVWTNDPSFDDAVLNHAASQHLGEFPRDPLWHYRLTRCCRTASDFITDDEYHRLKVDVIKPVPHRAVDDARMSAAVVQTMQLKKSMWEAAVPITMGKVGEA